MRISYMYIELKFKQQKSEDIKMHEESLFNKLLRPALFLLLSSVMACSTEPKITDFDPSADPQVELAHLDQQVEEAKKNLLDILSPENFKSALKARKAAVEASSRNKDQRDILYKLAISQKYLEDATTVATVANQLLVTVIEARKDAVAANAEIHYTGELNEIDKKFTRLTKQIEKNNTSINEQFRDTIESNYRELELKSLKKDKLGVAQNNIERAINEGAKNLTPVTLAWTEKKYSEAEATIEANRHNALRVDNASKEAISATERLLNIVRLAKRAIDMDPEDYALQAELRERELAEAERQIEQTQARLSETEEELQNITGVNVELTSKIAIDSTLESIEKQLARDEAEVYRQGDSILMRLKGLNFPSNEAAIQDEDLMLMSKVQNVVAEARPIEIIIEGHTDSIGDEKLNKDLSLRRAEAVRDFLISNIRLDESIVTVKGLADSRPIATNSTPEGRAHNRRVDVILTTEPLRTTIDAADPSERPRTQF